MQLPSEAVHTSTSEVFTDLSGYTNCNTGPGYMEAMGPQFDNCEGEGADVKAWICCSPTCATCSPPG